MNAGDQRRWRTQALALIALAAIFVLLTPRSLYAFSASGQLTPSGSGTGSGVATTRSGTSPSIQISLQSATPGATYAVLSCLPLTGGDFDCVGRNRPPGLQQVIVAPRALAPITVSLVQQGSISVDGKGNGTTSLGLIPVLLSDTPHSIYNVVQLVNVKNMAESYTALDLQTPLRPVAGVYNIPPVSVTLVVGVPVYLLAPFPGYLYPVAITTIPGVPFAPFIAVPPNAIGGAPLNVTVGGCPNGQPPIAQPSPVTRPADANGQIELVCRFP